MSDQVTIKLDSKILYGLIAVVAVLGIFAIGWWLGTQLNQPQQAAAPGADAAAPVVQQPVIQENIAVNPDVSAAQQAPVAVAASKPVSIAAVPVGESEPRLALPEVEATNFTWDFGKIPADEVTEKDFVIENVGTAELVIEEASATCGCTAALVADSTVGTGEQTTVRVSYDPRVNREAGRYITKQVRIKSNDPLVPLAEFTISADVAAQ